MAGAFAADCDIAQIYRAEALPFIPQRLCPAVHVSIYGTSLFGYSLSTRHIAAIIDARKSRMRAESGA